MSIALLIIGGLIALFFGAEWLVRGSSSLAIRLGVTPLLVGLTVVAYGTSAPEMIVSTVAAMNGEGPIAIGNSVGSNMMNIGIILGITALICPMRVEFQLLKLDTPVMVAAGVLFLVFFQDTQISFWEAVIFLAFLVIYTLVNIRLARKAATKAVKEQFAEGVPKQTKTAWLDIVLIIGGLGVLVLGSRMFVSGAVHLARGWGISEAIIGLTIVAGGTSLPELAASVMAAIRRQPDIALGNVIGSNICNILAVLGLSGVVAAPVSGTGVSFLDVYVMIGFFFALLILAWTGFILRRWEGGLLLAGYGVYLWNLWPT